MARLAWSGKGGRISEPNQQQGGLAGLMDAVCLHLQPSVCLAWHPARQVRWLAVWLAWLCDMLQEMAGCLGAADQLVELVV